MKKSRNQRRLISPESLISPRKIWTVQISTANNTHASFFLLFNCFLQDIKFVVLFDRLWGWLVRTMPRDGSSHGTGSGTDVHLNDKLFLLLLLLVSLVFGKKVERARKIGSKDTQYVTLANYAGYESSTRSRWPGCPLSHHHSSAPL